MNSTLKIHAGLTLLAKVGLCLAFVYSGISKTFDFQSALDEQAHFGLQPAAVFAVATIVTQLAGSALVLLGRGRAAIVGACVLAGFTLVATIVGHPFWHEAGAERFRDLNEFLEHFGLISGFLLVALSQITPSGRSQADPL